MDQKVGSGPKDPIRLQQARAHLSANTAQRGMDRLRKAICDPARLTIIEALSVGELSVNDLALAIGRAPAATSQHLKILRQLEIVDGVRRGTCVYYHLNKAAAGELEAILDRLATAPASNTA